VGYAAVVLQSHASGKKLLGQDSYVGARVKAGLQSGIWFCPKFRPVFEKPQRFMALQAAGELGF
jgi:hypothetical protein